MTKFLRHLPYLFGDEIIHQNSVFYSSITLIFLARSQKEVGIITTNYHNSSHKNKIWFLRFLFIINSMQKIFFYCYDVFFWYLDLICKICYVYTWQNKYLVVLRQIVSFVHLCQTRSETEFDKSF